jgi:coenzyme F420-reducing hydrogenase delta subunit
VVQVLECCNTRGLKAVDMATSEQMQLIYIERLLRTTANSDRTITYNVISVVCYMARFRKWKHEVT